MGAARLDPNQGARKSRAARKNRGLEGQSGTVASRNLQTWLTLGNRLNFRPPFRKTLVFHLTGKVDKKLRSRLSFRAAVQFGCVWVRGGGMSADIASIAVSAKEMSGRCPVDHSSRIRQRSTPGWSDGLRCSAGKREFKFGRYAVAHIRDGGEFAAAMREFRREVADYRKTGFLAILSHDDEPVRFRRRRTPPPRENDARGGVDRRCG